MKIHGKFFNKYKHGIPLIIFGIIYLTWFCYLEKTVTRHYTVIHMAVDDYIPFAEVFVVPYFLWFVYVAGVVIYFFFHNKNDYYKACAFLFTGMTIFLIVSTLWPNGQHLRPFIMPRNNIFTKMVSLLYLADTPTNLWPSIHVYNSIGTHVAIMKSKEFENKRGIQTASFILCVSIILSTVFLKQHSVFDVLTAFVMATVMYAVVYRQVPVFSFRRQVSTENNTRPQAG